MGITLAAAAADDGRDLYSGLVQVFPVLLLALVWESGFVAKLATEDHRRRSAARPQGVRFWTKSRVRVFSLTVTSTVVTEIALCALVLADAISASAVTRTLVLAGLLLALGTLLTRIGVDVWEATRQPVDGAPPRSPVPPQVSPPGRPADDYQTG